MFQFSGFYCKLSCLRLWIGPRVRGAEEGLLTASAQRSEERGVPVAAAAANPAFTVHRRMILVRVSMAATSRFSWRSRSTGNNDHRSKYYIWRKRRATRK